MLCTLFSIQYRISVQWVQENVPLSGKLKEGMGTVRDFMVAAPSGEVYG